MRRPLLWTWASIAVVAAYLMWAFPGSETVPYHIGWAAFALCYGLEPWGRTTTVVGLALYTVVSGYILVVRGVADVIDAQEAAEIPLMLLLICLMVWHVQRRQRALAEVTVLAARERSESEARELLTRRTSHEMRSPLTIANGYLEVLMAKSQDPDTLGDLSVIHEELARLTRACDRLIRSMWVRGDLVVSDVDVDGLLAQTAERWATVAPRTWHVDARAGAIECSAERLRACLDTMVENAVRYTGPGDTIQLHARRNGSTACIGVADSGPGFSSDVMDAVNAPASPEGIQLTRDDLSQTGLGLGLVMDVATRRGGRVTVGRSAFGGAQVSITIPVTPPPDTDRPVTAARVSNPSVLEARAWPPVGVSSRRR
ncbi:HAMP domain-containing sensor histidine kinase [Intrasporangium sp.]|uniref:sensor histidine kinase n=1 Tax=Intrasporangium sp. TaxID=1925024 RepID=UPI0033659C26